MKGARQWLDSSWGRSREGSPPGTGKIRFAYTLTTRREEFETEPPTRCGRSKKEPKTCWTGRRGSSARRCRRDRKRFVRAGADFASCGSLEQGDRKALKDAPEHEPAALGREVRLYQLSCQHVGKSGSEVVGQGDPGVRPVFGAEGRIVDPALGEVARHHCQRDHVVRDARECVEVLGECPSRLQGPVLAVREQGGPRLPERQALADEVELRPPILA